MVRDREVLSITEQGEPPLLRDLRAVLAQEERRKIAERTRAAAAAIHREGRYNGPAPLGYRFAAGVLVVVEHEAELVRRIFAECLAGRSLSAIARALNAEGVATKRGGRWRQGTLGALLRNPVYVGRVRMGEAEREGLHKAIVDEVTFARAQQLLTALSARKGGGRGRPPAASHLFVGGTLRCGECGEAITPRTPTRGNPYYLCSGSQHLGCTMPRAARASIDAAVYAYFEQVGLDVEATRQAVISARDNKAAETRALLKDAQAEASKAGERLARVRRDYADGELDISDWREFRAELGAEQEAAEAEAQRLRRRLAEIEAWEVDAQQEALEQLSQIRAAIVGEVREASGVEAVRAALARMFERFVLHRQGAGPQRLPAELGLVPGFVIEPVVREAAVAGHSPLGTPLLRREALEQAASNERQGVPQREFFTPIIV